MLPTTFLPLLFWCTTVSAAPSALNARWASSLSWIVPSKASSYIDYAKDMLSDDVCNMGQASMPQAPTALPSPAAGLTLSHVAIGRGTQNYTCDLSNSTAVPFAIGAVASLFNVSCMAVAVPALVSKLPAIALDLPIPFSEDPSNPANTDLSGYHYFLNDTTAFFNLDTSSHAYGNGAFKKANSSLAPTDAMAGPGGTGNGAVAWLKLDALTSDGQVFQEVYRVNTAGGNPPTTCEGQAATLEVPYAAEYWLYT